MDVAIDTAKLKLETDRLILRAFEEDDLNDFYEYASVEGVGEMAGWPRHKTMEESKMILDMFLSEKEVFALVLKENNKVIGSIGIHYSWANEDNNYKMLTSKEIGYVLSKNYWGKGLMPEAVSAVIDLCFSKLNIDALTCGHFQINKQSKRVIEKCGFTFVKEDEYFAQQLQKTLIDQKYILIHERVNLTSNGRRKL